MNIYAKLVMLPLVLQRLGTQVDCSMMPGIYSTISSLGGISWNFSRVCLCDRTISLVWLTIFGCVSLPKYTNIGCRPSRSIAGALNKPWYDVVYPQPSPKRHLVVLNLRNSNLFFLSSYQRTNIHYDTPYEEEISPTKPKTQI